VEDVVLWQIHITHHHQHAVVVNIEKGYDTDQLLFVRIGCGHHKINGGAMLHIPFDDPWAQLLIGDLAKTMGWMNQVCLLSHLFTSARMFCKRAGRKTINGSRPNSVGIGLFINYLAN